MHDINLNLNLNAAIFKCTEVTDMTCSKIFSVIFLILVAVFIQENSYAQCTSLSGSASAESKPFVWHKDANDEFLTGAIPDLAMNIAVEMNLPMSVKYVGPWTRTQNELRIGQIDLIWGAFRIKERAEYADFIPTPLTRVRSIVLSRLDDNWRFSKLSDLEGRAGVITLGDSYGEAFDKYASERLTISRVPNVASAIKMVLAKHVDYFILDEAIARSALSSMGINEIRVSETEVSGQDLFLLISKKSRCNTADLRERLNKALLTHKKNLTIDKALRKYWGG